MVVLKVRTATEADFNEILAQRDFSELDWDFVETSAAVLKFRNVSVHVESERGRYVVPLLARRVFKVYPVALSLPFGLYGGVLPAQGMDAPSYGAIMQAVRKHLGMGIVFQNPFSQGVLDGLPAAPVSASYAHIVDTEGRVWADVLAKSFEHKMRKNIKRAQQNKIEIRVGRSPELVRDFYRLYALSNVRWGRDTPRYDLDFFLRYAERPFLECRVAYDKDRPAAALIMLRFRNYYFGWFGGMDKALSNTRSNDLLHADLIKHSIESGVKCVNFGSSGKLAGVKKFKESFGAKEHTYGIYFVGNPLAQLGLKLVLSGGG